MTLQELGHIDELIAWLDNEQDGADDAGFVARSATNWHPALVALRSDVEQLQGQLCAAHDVRDVFARDLNRMVEDCDKDTAAHDALVASLTDELRRAKAKSEQYQIDWMAAKAEFGDKMGELRQRHELAVLMAWHEGEKWGESHPLSLCADRNAAWLASEAKARLT